MAVAAEKTRMLVGIAVAQITFHRDAFFRERNPAEFRPHGEPFRFHGFGDAFAERLGELDRIVPGHTGLNLRTAMGTRHAWKLSASSAFQKRGHNRANRFAVQWLPLDFQVGPCTAGKNKSAASDRNADDTPRH